MWPEIPAFARMTRRFSLGNIISSSHYKPAAIKKARRVMAGF
jgi:hypothetical protein